MKKYFEAGQYFEFKDIGVDKIKITQEVRDRCEDNFCGNYGKNYMCPPSVGDLDDYKTLVNDYKRGLLFSKVYPIEDKMDYTGMMEAGIEFRNDIQELNKEMKSDNINCLFFSAGCCNICEKCAIISDEPCRFPTEAIPSLEAAGINVVELTRDYGFKYNNGPLNVTYFGLMLYTN
ncbi:MAG: DUF2284 domain-containing protein [Acetobacterium sp.]